MEEEILKLLGGADYAPLANVPELLRLLRWPPNRQQQLQQMLQRLEQTGRITRGPRGIATFNRAKPISFRAAFASIARGKVFSFLTMRT